MWNSIKKIVVTLLSCYVFMHLGYALDFPMPVDQNSVLGQLHKVRVGWGDDFNTIGRRYDLGHDAMVCANPRFQSAALPLFYHVVVPAKFILPAAPREGIIINVAEKRLFYYDQQDNTVMTFPVGIGKQGWSTPTGIMTVVEKIISPTWIPPKDVLQELTREGYTNISNEVPPGPQNPLGDFAMRLSRSMYLIHGTNAPDSIGTQASSGCIRLYPEDIARLFQAVPQGTDVRIVNEPYLLGWNNNTLYLVVFADLDDASPLNLVDIEKEILAQTKDKTVTVDWRKVAYLTLIKNGIPEIIARV